MPTSAFENWYNAYCDALRADPDYLEGEAEYSAIQRMYDCGKAWEACKAECLRILTAHKDAPLFDEESIALSFVIREIEQL